MALPAHPPMLDDDSDEELSPQQIQELLAEAERSIRAKQQKPQSDVVRLPKLNPGHIADLSMKTEGNVTRLDHSKLIDQRQRALAEGIKKIDDPVQLKQQKLEEKKATAGSEWFNMPKTDLTPELKRDLQLLKMRSVLDPKRFFKKDASKPDVPAFSQVGTIVEGPTDFFNSRINKKDRKATFLDEVLATEAKNHRFKNKFHEITTSKSSGKKNFYKGVLEKRKSSGVQKKR